MQAPFDTDTLPPENEYHNDNIAYGISSHFRTTFETDALINGICSLGSRNVPFVVCKIRSEENLDYSLTALNDAGASWLIGDFKGCGNNFAYLFNGNISPADLTYDSYETIGEKWSKPIATKNFTENKDQHGDDCRCDGGTDTAGTDNSDLTHNITFLYEMNVV